MTVENSLIDKRSLRIVFVPFCLLCQAFQAKGIVKGEWSSTIHPIVSLLNSKDINIIQLPCPESSFNGYEKGLGRKPAGLKYYDTPEYREHCQTLVKQVMTMVKGILKNGYSIEGVLGIELSPSCAISYIYTNKGMQKRKGIFMELLEARLIEEEISLEFIGVNRRGIKKAIKQLSSLL